MNAIESVESPDLKTGLPRLSPGDTVRVHVRVKETSVKEEKARPRRPNVSASRSSKAS